MAPDSILGRPAREQQPCEVVELRKTEEQGLRVWSPDGRHYLINKEDETGTAQIYVGEAEGTSQCITCQDIPNGPKRKRFKMQPHWHPSGRWIFIAVEREKYTTPPFLGLSRQYVEGMLQCGIWTNMYAVSPDGKESHQLSDFKSNVKGVADGFTGVAFTPDGKKAVWSQIMDGNIFVYNPFGRWELILADYVEENGVPKFVNLKNITPPGMHWNEPGNFHPDNKTLIFSGSDQKDQQGMDQYLLNIKTGRLVNLTRSPKVWDEHGVFSPDGEKIIFMSAYPYRNDPSASKVLSIKTEFMLMNKDGSNLRQLTHFRESGYPEYPSGIASNAEWAPDGRSVSALALKFPKYETWEIIFSGDCGNNSFR